MSSNQRWPRTPEEGEIIEPDDPTSNGLHYQFCVPPDESRTTDTNTTSTNLILFGSEPPLKRQKISRCIDIPNLYPTLTLHSADNDAATKSRANSLTKPLSPSPSPIFYYTQSHRRHKTRRRRRHYHSRNRNRHRGRSRSYRHRSRHHSARHRRRHSRSQSLSRSSSKSYKASKSHCTSDTDTTSTQNNIQIADITRSRLEILKQKAMESVQMKRDQLNSSGLLKDDLLCESFAIDSLCKSVVMKIVHNVTMNASSAQHVHHCAINMPKEGDVINEVQGFDKKEEDEGHKQHLAVLRALALKSLLSQSADTKAVDMEISDVENDDEGEKEKEIERNEEMQRQQRELQMIEIEKRKKEMEMNTFVIESQKLTLILAQIRQKTVEKNELMRMANLAAQELHVFIDKLQLTQDLHEQLNDVINEHIDCAKCKVNDVRNRMEIKRRKEKRIKKRIKCSQLLNETINDLDIDSLYGNKGEDDGDINLYDAYQNMQQYDIKNRELITAKIESNLLFYYQDHLRFATGEKYHEKAWKDLDFMREYTLNELSMLQ